MEQETSQHEQAVSVPGARPVLWRWRVRHWLDLCRPRPATLACPICLGSRPHREYARRRSECLFGGGPLLRYECPGCGVIFGTERMLALSPEALAREYRDLYSTYQEGDTTAWETMAFHALRPRAGGQYLNYGCGRWSKALPQLRAAGYDVVGYEPYAAGGQEFVLTDEAQLGGRRFDGIFTHNLIEHLQHPSEALRRMRGLLRDDRSAMVHSTACYDYRYEFSRFHLFFFTGSSVHVLARRAGLRVEPVDPPTLGEPDTRMYLFLPA